MNYHNYKNIGKLNSQTSWTGPVTLNEYIKYAYNEHFIIVWQYEHYKTPQPKDTDIPIGQLPSNIKPAVETNISMNGGADGHYLRASLYLDVTGKIFIRTWADPIVDFAKGFGSIVTLRTKA